MFNLRTVRALAMAGVLGTSGYSTGAAAVAATPPISCAPASEGSDATIRAMSSILSRAKERDNLRAIIFGAERNGKPILRTALGTSTDGVPATTAMHFRVGFVGWQYLVDLLLMMTDRKRIALTDSVSKWFPKYPHVDGAAVRMLAASSTGWATISDHRLLPKKFTKTRTAFGRRTTSSGEAFLRTKNRHSRIQVRTGPTRIPTSSCWERY